jgi:hypothetical protein
MLAVARPQNIVLEDDLTCEITRSSSTYADYILRKYGNERDHARVHYYLYRHGYYLRNFEKNTYVYISTGDGSVCPFRRFAVDTSEIIATTDSKGKLLTLGAK